MKECEKTGDIRLDAGAANAEEISAEIDYWLDGRVVCGTGGGRIAAGGAMIVVLEHIWQRFSEKLSMLDAVIVADACYPCTLRSVWPMKERLDIIVLAGELCDAPQDQQCYLIAHELAHFLLGHFNLSDAGPAELEADELAESWGFKRPPGLPPHPALCWGVPSDDGL